MSNVDDDDGNVYKNDNNHAIILQLYFLYFIEGIIHCISRYLICNENDRHKVRSYMSFRLTWKCKKQKTRWELVFIITQ